MQEKTYTLPSNYMMVCYSLYRQSLGCLLGGRPVMRWCFRPGVVLRVKSLGGTLLFANVEWEATVDFYSNTLKLTAINTDIIEKVVKENGLC